MKPIHAGRLFLASAVCAGLAAFAPVLRAADVAPTAPTKDATVDPKTTAADLKTPPTDAPKGARTREAVLADLNATGGELRSILTSPKFLSDGKLRAELAPKVIAPLNKMLSLFDELAAVDPSAKGQAKQVKNQFYTMLALFGDKNAEETLKTQAAGTDATEASPAKASLYMIAWARAEADAAAQTKVLDDIEKAAKANPTDDTLAAMVMQMAQMGPVTPEIKDRATKMLKEVFTGRQAKAAIEALDAESKIKSVEGKPLVIAGVKNDGSSFTTADWKGKVILVDFWATWCGPCREELPRVKKAYADFHAKGLEIVGVSCDNNAEALKGFLDKDKEMAWPQLFDATKPGWHELAKRFGIQGIPTMFLIDKKGMVRSVTARENFEELIPKMLEEN